MDTLTQTPQFKQVDLCPHCDALAELQSFGDEHFLFCSDGCGCLEGEPRNVKYECQHCKELCDQEECSCEENEKQFDKYEEYERH